jgi:aspartyl protease family protein
LYLVDEDVKFRDLLKTLRIAKNQMDSGNGRRAQLEKRIKAIDTALDKGSDRYRELSAELPSEQANSDAYNQTIGQINDLRDQMLQAVKQARDLRTQEATLPDPRDAYIEALMELSDSMEAGMAKYQALAADPDVKTALTTINSTARVKVRLGPSGDFAEELPLIRQQRATVNSEAIKFHSEGGTPQVDVALDGTVTVPMILDSGASLVSLSWDVAQKLGMTPGPDDPKVKFLIADGSVVQASIMHIKSVRLGQFEAKDVLCSVAPQSAKQIPNLLGDSYLRNFVYRMDLDAGVVHMSQLAPKAPDTKPAEASQSPTATAKLGANEVAVAAIRTQSNPFATGILLKAGQPFAIDPNVEDTWSKQTGSHAGKPCDFRGYADRPGLLAMKWKIGDSVGTVVYGDRVIAPATGELFLFCSDDQPAQNQGSVRATIDLKPQALPADSP